MGQPTFTVRRNVFNSHQSIISSVVQLVSPSISSCCSIQKGRTDLSFEENRADGARERDGKESSSSFHPPALFHSPSYKIGEKNRLAPVILSISSLPLPLSSLANCVLGVGSSASAASVRLMRLVAKVARGFSIAFWAASPGKCF